MAEHAIDPHQSWLALESAAEREPSSELRHLILLVRDHMRAEIKGELEPLMATLTAQPTYHFWGNGEPLLLQGREAVQGFYANMFENKGQQFQVVIDKTLASAQGVITEGQVKQIYKGATVKAAGLHEVAGKPIANDDLFVSNAQLITVWPAADDGLLVGEDIYFGVSPLSTLQPTVSAALPDYYQL